MSDDSENAAIGLTAPYPAFSTLKTLIKPFKEHGGAPSRIDRSVLTSFSGQVGSQVLTMLKFLNLTDPGGRPTQALTALVSAFDTDAWQAALSNVIRPAYEPIFALNLETASPNEFAQHFRKTYPASEEVSRKAMTFFLNAAQEAGYKISPYILKGKKPRSGPTKKRVAKTAASAVGSAQVKGAGGIVPPIAPIAEKLPSETLLSLFDPGMAGEEQNAIWTLIKFFKAKGK